MNINQLLIANNYNIHSGVKFLWDIWDSEIRIITILSKNKKCLGQAYVDYSGNILKLTAEIPYEDFCFCWFEEDFKKEYVKNSINKGNDYLKAWDDVKYTIIDSSVNMLDIIEILTSEDYERIKKYFTNQDK